MQPKSFFVLFIAAVTGAFFIGSCQRTVTPTIVGKWTMVTAIGKYQLPTGGMSLDTTRYTAADYYEFKSDSTITIMATGKTYSGRWKMLNNKLFISGTNYMDYPAGFDLPILTTTDLQIYYTETAPLFLEQKLNLTR